MHNLSSQKTKSGNKQSPGRKPGECRGASVLCFGAARLFIANWAKTQEAPWDWERYLGCGGNSLWRCGHIAETSVCCDFPLDAMIRSILQCVLAGTTLWFFKVCFVGFFYPVHFPWKFDFHLGWKFTFLINSTEMMNLKFVLYFIFQCGQCLSKYCVLCPV